MVLLLDQQLFSNHIYLMFVGSLLFAVADSGAAISLDARRRGERGVVARWPVWLLRVQVSIVYGYAALSKINLPFLSGSVIASSLRRDGFLAVPDGWRVLEVMLVLAVLTVIVEAFVAVALWLPRWRPAAFVVGLGLHIGITGWLVPGYQLLVFSVLMLPLYVLFIPLPASGVCVVWDDGCSFCGRWVTWFRRLDWLHVLQFVPRSELAATSLPVTAEEAAEALQLVADGRVRAGYRAVAGVASLLPLCFLWAPLLRLCAASCGGRRGRRLAQEVDRPAVDNGREAVVIPSVLPQRAQQVGGAAIAGRDRAGNQERRQTGRPRRVGSRVHQDRRWMLCPFLAQCFHQLRGDVARRGQRQQVDILRRRRAVGAQVDVRGVAPDEHGRVRGSVVVDPACHRLAARGSAGTSVKRHGGLRSDQQSGQRHGHDEQSNHEPSGKHRQPPASS
jgi:predicted DCC family thiol-disulfide oxidoreductase YuxK